VSQKELLKQKACELIDNNFSDEPFGEYVPSSLYLEVSFKDKVHRGLKGSVLLSTSNPSFKLGF